MTQKNFWIRKFSKQRDWPYWAENGDQWLKTVGALRGTIKLYEDNYLDSSPTAHTETVDTNLTTQRYWGGILAPNGHVYGVPYQLTQAQGQPPNNWWHRPLKINGDGESQVIPGVNIQVTALGLDFYDPAWLGGALGVDGCIYCAPQCAKYVLKIDPSTDTSSLVSWTSGVVVNAWAGGVCRQNGDIIFAPFNHSGFYRLYDSYSSYAIHGDFGTDTGKNAGCVLAPNGTVYAIPYNSTHIAYINPDNSTGSIHTYDGSHAKYVGAVLASDGMIYFIPHSEGQVLKLNPTTNLVSSVSAFNTFTYSSFGCLGADGRVYWCPRSTSFTQLYHYDTETTNITDYSSKKSNVSATVLHGNGRLITVPFEPGYSSCIGSWDLNLDQNQVLSRYFNNS